MGSLPLRQSEAAKWTKAAWGATALAGAAAVIIFVLPKAKPTLNLEDAAGEQAAQTPEQTRKHPTDDLGPQNWSTLTGSMLTLESSQPELEQWRRMVERLARERAEKESENAPANGESGPAIVGGFSPSWRYLGLMWSGKTPLAIIEIDAKQRLVRVGDQPIQNDQFTVESIDAEKVIVSRGRNRYEIKREATTRGTQLTDASALADPNDGVFGDQTGAARRARNIPRNSPR
jgi:hypothetical protein